MNKLNLTVRILIHITFWSLILIFNYVFLWSYAFKFDFWFHVSIILIYASIYYATYYWLMDCLFNKKIVLFIALSMLLLSSTLYAKDLINKKYIEQKIKENDGDPFPFKRFNKSMFPIKPNEFMEMGPIRNRMLVYNTYGVLVFFALSFSIRFIKKWQDDERLKSELEKEKIKSELGFLKQQINPHFLFNSLNSIYSLSISKSDKATDSILKLSSILRHVLYESEKKQVLLKDEIQIIHNYIELQKIRLTDKVKLNYKVIGITEDYKIEPSLFIPLIENAFKHGVDNANDTFINIHIEVVDDKLLLKISNKKVFKPEILIKEAGIGINNIKRQLELLYPESYRFEIFEDQDIFRIELELKLKS